MKDLQDYNPSFRVGDAFQDMTNGDLVIADDSDIHFISVVGDHIMFWYWCDSDVHGRLDAKAESIRKNLESDPEFSQFSVREVSSTKYLVGAAHDTDKDQTVQEFVSSSQGVFDKIRSAGELPTTYTR